MPTLPVLPTVLARVRRRAAKRARPQLAARVRAEPALTDRERELHGVGRGELVHHELNARRYARRERGGGEWEVGARRQERAHVLHVLDVRWRHEPLTGRQDVGGHAPIPHCSVRLRFREPRLAGNARDPDERHEHGERPAAEDNGDPCSGSAPSARLIATAPADLPPIRRCAFMSDKRARPSAVRRSVRRELTKERRATSAFIRAGSAARGLPSRLRARSREPIRSEPVRTRKRGGDKGAQTG